MRHCLFLLLFLSLFGLFSCKIKGYESTREHYKAENRLQLKRERSKRGDDSRSKARERAKLSKHSTEPRSRFSKRPPRIKDKKPAVEKPEAVDVVMVADELVNKDSDMLIIFYSRSGEQFEIGAMVNEGDAEVVAEALAAATGADIWQIEPVDPNRYPRTYKEALAIAKEEQLNNTRPEYIKKDLPDLSHYKTIFIGAPVWHDDWPMIVYSYFDDAKDELKDKTLVPFCTHSGSGIAPLVSKLYSIFPDTEIKEGLAIRGIHAQESYGTVKTEIAAWLKGMSL